jgi:hypothetical protein
MDTPAEIAHDICIHWDANAAAAIDTLVLQMRAPLPANGGDLVPPLAAAVFALIWPLHVYGFAPRPFPRSALAAAPHEMVT